MAVDKSLSSTFSSDPMEDDPAVDEDDGGNRRRRRPPSSGPAERASSSTSTLGIGEAAFSLPSLTVPGSPTRRSASGVASAVAAPFLEEDQDCVRIKEFLERQESLSGSDRIDRERQTMLLEALEHQPARLAEVCYRDNDVEAAAATAASSAVAEVVVSWGQSCGADRVPRRRLRRTYQVYLKHRLPSSPAFPGTGNVSGGSFSSKPLVDVGGDNNNNNRHGPQGGDDSLGLPGLLRPPNNPEGLLPFNQLDHSSVCPQPHDVGSCLGVGQLQDAFGLRTLNARGGKAAFSGLPPENNDCMMGAVVGNCGVKTAVQAAAQPEQAGGIGGGEPGPHVPINSGVDIFKQNPNLSSTEPFVALEERTMKGVVQVVEEAAGNCDPGHNREVARFGTADLMGVPHDVAEEEIQGMSFDCDYVEKSDFKEVLSLALESTGGSPMPTVPAMEKKDQNDHSSSFSVVTAVQGTMTSGAIVLDDDDDDDCFSGSRVSVAGGSSGSFLRPFSDKFGAVGDIGRNQNTVGGGVGFESALVRPSLMSQQPKGPSACSSNSNSSLAPSGGVMFPPQHPSSGTLALVPPAPNFLSCESEGGLMINGLTGGFPSSSSSSANLYYHIYGGQTPTVVSAAGSALGIGGGVLQWPHSSAPTKQVLGASAANGGDGGQYFFCNPAMGGTSSGVSSLVSDPLQPKVPPDFMRLNGSDAAQFNQERPNLCQPPDEAANNEGLSQSGLSLSTEPDGLVILESSSISMMMFADEPAAAALPETAVSAAPEMTMTSADSSSAPEWDLKSSSSQSSTDGGRLILDEEDGSGEASPVPDPSGTNDTTKTSMSPTSSAQSSSSAAASSSSSFHVHQHLQQQPSINSPSTPSTTGKKPRTIFSDSQCSKMRETFQRYPYINRQVRDELAKDLDISPDTIAVWFKNQRSKLKKRKLQYRGENCIMK